MEVWGGNPRYRTYSTRDGKKVAVCLLEAKIWHRFCEAIGREDLIVDEPPEARLSNHAGHAEAFSRAISEYCLTHDRDELAARMMAMALPVVPVLTPDEAVSSAHVRDRGLVEVVEHPTEGRTFALRSGLVGSGLVRRRGPSPAIANAQRAD